MQKMTLATSFAFFGTSLRNARWSWSARNLREMFVVLAAWQDRFKKQDGVFVYESDEEEAMCTSCGANERFANLQWAMQHCEGLVKFVIVIAKDPAVSKREVADCFPHKTMEMRITKLDSITRAFRLEAVPR